MHAQSMAVSAHRLNLLVAFLFPLASMATVFGMNLSFGWGRTVCTDPILGGMWLRNGVGVALGFLHISSAGDQEIVRCDHRHALRAIRRS